MLSAAKHLKSRPTKAPRSHPYSPLTVTLSVGEASKIPLD